MNTHDKYEWRRDICRITDHISIQCWASMQRENTWQIKLRYQKNPGEPRIIIYKRYLHAYSYDGAKRQAFPACLAWMKRHKARPDSIPKSIWNELCTAFSLEHHIET